MKRYTLLFSLLLAPVALMFGQTAGGDHNLTNHWKTSKEFTLAVAGQMPAESYDFKLTPAQMSFGEQMAHIAESNGYFFSTVKGEKSPVKKPATLDKASVLKMLNESFDYSAAVLAAVTPEQLHKSQKGEGGEMTGAEMIMLAFDHTTHHRSACEMYLRAKNITPTDYRF